MFRSFDYYLLGNSYVCKSPNKSFLLTIVYLMSANRWCKRWLWGWCRISSSAQNAAREYSCTWRYRSHSSCHASTSDMNLEELRTIICMCPLLNKILLFPEGIYLFIKVYLQHKYSIVQRGKVRGIILIQLCLLLVHTTL